MKIGVLFKNVKYLIIFLLLFLSCKTNIGLSKSKEISVLFIGNSLTYYSDMPKMLQEMLNETHPNVKIDQSTFPGYSLSSHVNNIIISQSENETSVTKKPNGSRTRTEKKILEKNWDVIILQTGGVSVLIPEARNISNYNAIRHIKSLAKNPNCKYLLFSTWATKVDYPKQYCYSCYSIDESIEKDDCCSEKITNKGQYVSLLNESYSELAKTLNLTKTGHTDVAYFLENKHPEIEIFLDNIHPNENGAFLNACIFYKMLTNTSPKKLDYSAGINTTITTTIKAVVNRTIKKSPLGF